MKTVKAVLAIALLGGFLISANAQTNQANSNSISSDFASMEKSMNKMFHDMKQKYFDNDKYASAQPKSKFSNDSAEYVISMKLPGFDKSNIHISTKDKMLSVEAKNYRHNETSNDQNYQSSTYEDSFYRSFLLPDNAKMQDMKTDYKNGILTIKIPKA